MPPIFTNARRWQVTLVLAGILASLWAWFGAVEAFHINTAGFGGGVTVILWMLYLFIPPLLAFILFLVAIVSAIRRTEPWPKPVRHAVIAAAAACFWYWSIVHGTR
jgi:hypothetical protein